VSDTQQRISLAEVPAPSDESHRAPVAVNADGTVFDSYHLLSWLGRQPCSKLPHSATDMESMGMAPRDDVSDPVHFPRLERLRLDNFSVPQETVASIVSKFRQTLRAIHFKGMGLVDLANTLQDRADVWSPLLMLIAEQTSLREWSIGDKAAMCYPRDEVPGGGPSYWDVYFGVSLREIAYCGVDANASLAAAADEVWVLWDNRVFVEQNSESEFESDSESQ
ncbi:hypothetical protein GE09DRAFT_1251982, partial [Coniochaeta sp. 2T2.1]